MTIHAAFLIIPILLAAAIQDYLQHQISNWLSLIIAIIALSAKGITAFVEGIIILVFLLLLSCITHSSIGGGDIKLCAAIGMVTGIYSALFILIGALLLLILWATARREKGALPVAPFLFIAYIAIQLKGAFFNV